MKEELCQLCKKEVNDIRDHLNGFTNLNIFMKKLRIFY